MVSSSEAGGVGLVVPAAGAGKRMGGRRKQFRVLGDAPILVQTLRRFESHPDVDAIVVAAPKGEAEGLLAELKSFGIDKLVSVVPGGETRQASVMRAVSAVPASVRFILVHDAVRPFVEHESISRVIELTRQTGAAALAVPVTDTLRRASDGVFDETVARAALFQMQTPQGFRREWLIESHRRADEEGWAATDDVEVVRRTGHPVAVVKGGGLNLKITTSEDFKLAQLLWDNRQSLF